MGGVPHHLSRLRPSVPPEGGLRHSSALTNGSSTRHRHQTYTCSIYLDTRRQNGCKMRLCVGLETFGVHRTIQMDGQSWNAEDWAVDANLSAQAGHFFIEVSSNPKRSC